MRLGTSSPNTMLTKVMMATTIAVAAMPATPAEAPNPAIQRARSALNAASPTMPISMLIEVMPTCTVDRNWVGCSSRRSAVAAPASSASASAISRALRLDARAISDIANTPLSSVNSAISRKSTAREGIRTRWDFI